MTWSGPGLPSAEALSAHEVPRHQVQLLVIDPLARSSDVTPFGALPGLLDAGDLLVVNDAATFPASLWATTEAGAHVEVRLFDGDGERWRAVLFGPGDWRTRTEDRPAPPRLATGAALDFGGLVARVEDVSARSARLVGLAFEAPRERVWRHLYARGAPVQYAHRQAPEPLWSFQNAYAARPWAAEQASAGRPLTWALLLECRRRGVRLATLTHATGLSATGDAALDAVLPLPERYELPAETAAAVTATVRAGRRVVAVGTSVMRAIESAALADGQVRADHGVASLIIDERHRLKVTSGLLTGLHSPQESHYRLLRSLLDEATLEQATQRALASGLAGHEWGDAALVLPGALTLQRRVLKKRASTSLSLNGSRLFRSR